MTSRKSAAASNLYTIEEEDDSEHSENHDDSGGEAAGGRRTLIDFLGVPPSSYTDSSAESSSASGQTNGRTKWARKHVKPKRRVSRAMAEIRQLQNSTNLLIPRLPFQRYVRPKKKHKKYAYFHNFSIHFHFFCVLRSLLFGLFIFSCVQCCT